MSAPFSSGSGNTGSPGGSVRDERGQVGRQVLGQGQGRGLAVLRVARGHGHAGVGAEVERLGRDRPDFGVAQARCDRQPIAQRPGRAGHTPVGRSPLRGVDEAAQFVQREGPAVVAAIFLGVEPRHPDQGVRRQPARLPSPAGKGADRGPVVVARRQRSALGPDGGQRGLNAVGGQVRPPSALDPLRDALPGSLLFRSLQPRRVQVGQSATPNDRNHPAARSVNKRVCFGVAPLAVRSLSQASRCSDRGLAPWSRSVSARGSISPSRLWRASSSSLFARRWVTSRSVAPLTCGGCRARQSRRCTTALPGRLRSVFP